jgi:uncharacterized circularly permuted ATP-grasp superfamily protein/uncharacterized alpha-E superfamily protein
LSLEAAFAPFANVRNRRIASWLSDYRPAQGISDELMDEGGRPRPHWLLLLEALAEFGEAEIDQRFARAGRRIDEMGITYRLHGEARERPAPLSRLPLLLKQAEWARIESGISQRAELLDLLLHDIYGENRLVSEGALPALAVAGSPEYVRPMNGVKPAGGRWLRFYAADIARGADGEWRVFRDRAQAPSGPGYALENRLIMARTFPSLFRDMNVRRLASFFRDFRAGLAAAAPRADPRICLLTPGVFSETYAEQVSLARYLGLLLVEGEDLIAEDGKLFVRTIAGLKRVDVLWRRVDADWCDPLEANAASRLGAPGLFDAFRRGAIAMANPPGAGLVESRALMSLLPALARRLLGEDLRIANVETLWCGREDSLARAMAELDQRLIKGAFGPGALGRIDARGLYAPELGACERTRLIAAMSERGMDFAAQEQMALSTTPAWVDGALQPRPFTLRVFAAATKDGWVVMPGGYCRVYDSQDPYGAYPQASAPSADVWVLSDTQIDSATLLPPSDNAHIVRVPGLLPSRAADNLYWMGRYLERTEAVLRLVRALCNRLAEARHDDRQPIDRLLRQLIAWGCVRDDSRHAAPARLAFLAVSDGEAYGSALSAARAARRTASIVRERLSQDMWQLLGGLEARLQCAPPSDCGALGFHALSEPEIVDCAESALQTIAALSGLMDENFNRVAGWSFLDLGKRIERAINTCRLTRQFAEGRPTMESLDVLIELIDSQITYRSRYLSGAAQAPALDMAVLDPFNPRSVAFQAVRIDDHLAALPALLDDGVMERPRRMSTLLRAELTSKEAKSIDAAAILAIEQRLLCLGEAITERYFSHRDSALAITKRAQLA